MKSLLDSLAKINAPKSDYDLTNLNEHLRSLTSDEALYHLQQEYDKTIQPIGQYSDVGKTRGFVIDVPVGFVNSSHKRQQFIDYLDKLMWYITIDYGVKNKMWRIGIEPVEADNVTEWVHRHDYIYHITSTSRTSNIFCPDTVTGIGLRPRRSNYRHFPKRVHFICPDNGSQFKNEVYTLIKQLSIPLSELRIFRIELRKLNKNIQFYRDTMYDEKGFIYAFVKFPWDVMDEIKL